jgi:hypothetical protein
MFSPIYNAAVCFAPLELPILPYDPVYNIRFPTGLGSKN